LRSIAEAVTVPVRVEVASRSSPNARLHDRARSDRRPRERGSLGGRCPVITADKLTKARDHIAARLTVREAATRLKVANSALYKALEGAAAK